MVPRIVRCLSGVAFCLCTMLTVVGVDDDSLSNNENAAHYDYNEEGLELYLAKEGANSSVKDRLGRTLLMVFSEKGQLACVERLLPYGDIDALSDSGMSALMYACTTRDTAAVVAGAILNAGADILIQDRWGETAKMIACRWGDCSLLGVLLERNPDLMIRNLRGQTALRLALERRDSEIVDLLLRAAFEAGPIHEQGVGALLMWTDDDAMVPLPEEDVRRAFGLYYGYLPEGNACLNTIWKRISLIFRFLLSPFS